MRGKRQNKQNVFAKKRIKAIPAARRRFSLRLQSKAESTSLLPASAQPDSARPRVASSSSTSVSLIGMIFFFDHLLSRELAVLGLPLPADIPISPTLGKF